MPPAEDICHVCQENAVGIVQSANYTEDEKKELLVTAEKHLGCAKSKGATTASTLKVTRRGCNLTRILHLHAASDYVQTVDFPAIQKPREEKLLAQAY